MGKGQKISEKGSKALTKRRKSPLHKIEKSPETVQKKEAKLLEKGKKILGKGPKALTKRRKGPFHKIKKLETGAGALAKHPKSPLHKIEKSPETVQKKVAKLLEKGKKKLKTGSGALTEHPKGLLHKPFKPKTVPNKVAKLHTIERK